MPPQPPNDMDLIEQAIFTSAETDRSAGYQVVATSPGVPEADSLELAVWCPSHNALLESGPNAVSYNFHPLPSGRYCVSRTAPAGWEYSHRGGARVYTQCLIASAKTLARFANNPFALLRAALAGGVLELHDQVPERLAPVRLAGRAAAVDSALLARLSANPGPDWLGSLVQAALTSSTVAIVGALPAEHLIAALINCLPPECRREFSFSTGLKFSSRRPFRVVALADDREEQFRIQRLYDVALLDFNGPPPADFAPVESWARFIHRALRSGRTSLLAHGLARRHCELAPEDLPALGLQLLEELDASSLETDEAEQRPQYGDVLREDACIHELPADHGALGRAATGNRWSDQTPAEEEWPDAATGEDAWPGNGSSDDDWQLWGEDECCTHAAETDECLSSTVGEDDWPGETGDEDAARHPREGIAGASRETQQDAETPPADAREVPRADAPRPGFVKRAHDGHSNSCNDPSPGDGKSKASKPSAGSQNHDLHSPDVLDRLERLDDLVYDAIRGKPAALEELKSFWPQVRNDLGCELLSESKEQYLRYALSTWTGTLEPDRVRDPARAIQSLEVLCLLFDQV